jgi:hypothetical protein
VIFNRGCCSLSMENGSMVMVWIFPSRLFVLFSYLSRRDRDSVATSCPTSGQVGTNNIVVCDRAIHASDGFIFTRARALTTIAARVDGASIKLTEVQILSQKQSQVSCVERKLSPDAQLGWTRLFLFSHC